MHTGEDLGLETEITDSLAVLEGLRARNWRGQFNVFNAKLIQSLGTTLYFSQQM